MTLPNHSPMFSREAFEGQITTIEKPFERFLGSNNGNMQKKKEELVKKFNILITPVRVHTLSHKLILAKH